MPGRPWCERLARGFRAEQAQDALALILRHPAADLPRSIKDGAQSPADLSDYDDLQLVVIPFERPPAVKGKDEHPAGEIHCAAMAGSISCLGRPSLSMMSGLQSTPDTDRGKDRRLPAVVGR